jgi:hypothetical protein
MLFSLWWNLVVLIFFPRQEKFGHVSKDWKSDT